MSRSTDVYRTGSWQITLNANTVTQVPAYSGVLAQQLKLVGGGTVAIGGPTTTQAAINATFAGATGAAGMYYLSANEIFSWNNNGPLYLYCSATATVAVIMGRSMGDAGELF